jgi:hypothetical protein
MRADGAIKPPRPDGGEMSIFIESRSMAVPSRARGLVALCAGAGIYVFFLVHGNYLLQDSDTYWHIKIGQWIIDHRAMPYSDVYSLTRLGEPWISSSWLAEVLYAAAYGWLDWGGPVILASFALAATIAIFVYLLSVHFDPARSIVLAMLALLMSAHHFVARPHILAMPVMVAFVGGLMVAADRRSSPSWLLLPLVPLWASLHGGFVLGLALIGAIGLEALWSAEAERRIALAARWALFGVAALVASCATPYGWYTPLGAGSILSLGELLSVISEWQAVNFSSLGWFEGALLGLIGLAFYRGFVLSPPRIMLLVGLIWMALTHVRNIEIFAFLAPLVVAKPFAEQSNPDGAAILQSEVRLNPYITLVAALTIAAAGWVSTSSYLAHHHYTFTRGHTPAAAVDILEQRHITRVFNQPEFGGYMITRGMRPFIDGRAELYGEKYVMKYFHAIEGRRVDDLIGMLDEYQIEATLLFAKTPASQILDHIPGWKRIYTDDLVVIHVREGGPQTSAAAAPDASR